MSFDQSDFVLYILYIISGKYCINHFEELIFFFNSPNIRRFFLALTIRRRWRLSSLTCILCMWDVAQCRKLKDGQFPAQPSHYGYFSDSPYLADNLRSSILDVSPRPLSPTCSSLFHFALLSCPLFGPVFLFGFYHFLPSFLRDGKYYSVASICGFSFAENSLRPFFLYSIEWISL